MTRINPTRVLSSIRVFVWMGVFFIASYAFIAAIGILFEIIESL